MVQRRGNSDNAILDMLRQIAARLDVVETAPRRATHLDEVSHDEAMIPNPNPKPKEDQDEERLLRVLSRAHSKPVVEIVPYNGKFDTNAVLNWISNMEKFFEYENTPNNRKVKLVVTRLKVHALLW